PAGHLPPQAGEGDAWRSRGLQESFSRLRGKVAAKPTEGGSSALCAGALWRRKKFPAEPAGLLSCVGSAARKRPLSCGLHGRISYASPISWPASPTPRRDKAAKK